MVDFLTGHASTPSRVNTLTRSLSSPPPCPPGCILLSRGFMSQPPNNCVNHPQTVAKRKCYYCLAYICPTCQKRAGGHIFCSNLCYFRYEVGEKLAGVKRIFLRLQLRLRRIGKAAERLTGGWVFRLLFLGLLLTILYQTLLVGQMASEISFPAIASPPVYPMPTAELVHGGEWITIAGSAPGYNIAVLLSDGVEREFCAVSENQFSFNFQPVEGSRSVQVRVFGDSLPSLYTRPIPLPEREAPAVAKPQALEKKPGKTTLENPPEKAGEPGIPLVKKIPKAPMTAAPAHHEDICRVKTQDARIAITFDGGSYDNAAGKILDVLAERGLEATFFLTGEFMNRHPEMTRKIAGEGHEVGNHTYSHLHLTTYEKNFRHDTLPGVTRELVLEELTKNEDLFFTLTGRKMVKLWRAPYGEQNRAIRQWAAEAGYRHISWTYDPKTRKSLDTLDWVADRDSVLFLTSDQIIEKILSFDTETEMGLGGGIVLLHLGSERDKDPFYLKLGILIDRLQERGYRIEPVGQLLQAGG